MPEHFAVVVASGRKHTHTHITQFHAPSLKIMILPKKSAAT